MTPVRAVLLVLVVYTCLKALGVPSHGLLTHFSNDSDVDIDSYLLKDDDVSQNSFRRLVADNSSHETEVPVALTAEQQKKTKREIRALQYKIARFEKN